MSMTLEEEAELRARISRLEREADYHHKYMVDMYKKLNIVMNAILKLKEMQ